MIKHWARLLVGLMMVGAVFAGCTLNAPPSDKPAGSGAAGGEAGAPASTPTTPTPTCTANQVRCDGQVPERCSEQGNWVATQAACAIACVAGECATCIEGTTACRNGSVQKCSGGSWTTVKVCPKACEGDTCVDTCTEGLSQCNGDRALQKCVQGEFVDDSTCDFVCRDGACSGSCAPDDRRCNPSATNESQTCDANGKWGASSPCMDGTFCVDGACAACKPGSARCGTAGPQTCGANGEWANADACDSAKVCFEGKCVACNPGDKRCNGQAIEQCATDGSRWTTIDTCSGSTPACLSSTTKCGKCAKGETQCLGDDIQTCDDQGVFRTTTSCTGNTPKCQQSDRKCVTCLNGATRACGNCNTGTQTCANNAWGACGGEADLQTSEQYCGNCATKCSTGQVCESGSCLVDCGTKTRCGNSCVNLATDTSNCLSCGTKCTAPASNGSAVCTTSGCDISCNNTRCGSSCCGATPSGATAGCSGNSCTFTCSSGNHGCGGSTPPCYANTDGAHCGSSCTDCSKYAGTTGTCSSNQCACEGSSALLCGATVPTCGSWDFNSGTVEGWRFGDYYSASDHHWVGALGTTITNGSPALSAKFDSTAAGSGTAEFEVDLCPNTAIINLSTYTLSFDFYFQTTTGTRFSQDAMDSNDLFLASNNSVFTGCQPFTEPGSDQWIHATCSSLPSSATNLTIIFRLNEAGWGGNVFLDNVKFTPK
jgi:hypothetical protein